MTNAQHGARLGAGAARRRVGDRPATSSRCRRTRKRSRRSASTPRTCSGSGTGSAAATRWTRAIGLSTMLAIGPDGFRDMLAGFHAHGRALPDDPARAQPAGAAWACSRSGTRTSSAPQTVAVLPYDQYLERFPAYLQQLTMESNGKSRHARRRAASTTTPGPIFWGEPGTNGQHSFYQLIHQGTQLIPCDFIGFAQSLNPLGRAPRPADRERLRAGRGARVRQDRGGGRGRRRRPSGSSRTATFEGNRPTNTILAEQLTPETLGKLVALYEHSVFTAGRRSGASTRSTSGASSSARCSRSGSCPELEADDEPELDARLLDERADPALPAAPRRRP